MTLLSLRDLSADPGPTNREMHGLRNLNLDIAEGEHVALVGDRNAGPALLAEVLVSDAKHRATVSSGTIWCETPGHGRMMLSQLRSRLRDFVLTIPADPFAHFQPERPVLDQILREMRRLGWRDRPTALSRIQAVLSEFGLPDIDLLLGSKRGALRSDALMAMALATIFACAPRIVIFQSSDLTDTVLLAEYAARVRMLCRAHDATLLTVSPSPAFAAEMSERSAIFYAGRIVEMGETRQLLSTPRHPYTHALIGMQPQAVRPAQPFKLPDGRPPLPGEVPDGCAFHTRCPSAFAGCYIETPSLIDQAGRRFACHRPLGEDG